MDEITTVLLHTGKYKKVKQLFYITLRSQCGPKHVGIFVLWHYCDTDELCAFVGVHCGNYICKICYLLGPSCDLHCGADLLHCSTRNDKISQNLKPYYIFFCLNILTFHSVAHLPIQIVDRPHQRFRTNTQQTDHRPEPNSCPNTTCKTTCPFELEGEIKSIDGCTVIHVKEPIITCKNHSAFVNYRIINKWIVCVIVCVKQNYLLYRKEGEGHLPFGFTTHKRGQNYGQNWLVQSEN